MNNPELYTKVNFMQKTDALAILRSFGNNIQWKKHNDKTIDVGCGDGSVTMDVLREYLPDNYEVLVGCDISEKMVRYAKERYGDYRTKFIVLDITKDVPYHLQGSFDHAVSFYALHWIKDQRRTFQNIYNLLAEGGDCLVLQIGYHPIFQAYREMSKNSKWKELMIDVEHFVSPYHDSKKPGLELQKTMTEIGFKNIGTKLLTKSFEYKSHGCMKKALTAINPFNIPNNLMDEYLEDLKEITCSLNRKVLADNVITEHLPAFHDYVLIVAFGTK